MNLYAIGRNIKAKMDTVGMKQCFLADNIGVTEVTMSRWLSGKRQPGSYALYRISKVFGCSMDELMEGIDE